MLSTLIRRFRRNLSLTEQWSVISLGLRSKFYRKTCLNIKKLLISDCSHFITFTSEVMHGIFDYRYASKNILLLHESRIS